MSKETDLEQVKIEALNCKKCSLYKGRTQLVFGSGVASARIMLIGEAPGKNEDECGEPFVGSAGKNLNAYLEQANLSRECVYIANILKCRPDANRNPKPEEIAACTCWLKRQIEIINPCFIVTLGNFATQFILQTKESISNLRGAVQVVNGRKVLPIFHPAAAIYDRKKRVFIQKDFEYLYDLLQKEGINLKGKEND